MMDYQAIIDRYYPEGSRLRDIYMRHCRSVAQLALELAEGSDLDMGEVEAAAMLHDIGIFLTNAPGIECRGNEPYIRHGVLGAELLRSLLIPGMSDVEAEWIEKMARVAERHTGAGISREDIVSQHLPLDPEGEYMPESKLEKIVCYADKFFSKSGSPDRKSLEDVRASMGRISAATLRRFDRMTVEFSPE